MLLQTCVPFFTYTCLKLRAYNWHFSCVAYSIALGSMPFDVHGPWKSCVPIIAVLWEPCTVPIKLG